MYTFQYFITDAIETDSYFSFIPMDIHVNVEQVFLAGTDEGFAGPIEIPGGFPFGSTYHTELYVSIYTYIHITCDFMLLL